MEGLCIGVRLVREEGNKKCDSDTRKVVRTILTFHMHYSLHIITTTNFPIQSLFMLESRINKTYLTTTSGTGENRHFPSPKPLDDGRELWQAGDRNTEEPIRVHDLI